MDPQTLNLVRQYLAAGKADSEIASALKQAGYSDSEISEALRMAESPGQTSFPPKGSGRNLLIATLLSFLWAGAGQIYNGQARKGIVLMALSAVLIAGMASLANAGSLAFAMAPLAAFWAVELYAMYNAYVTARNMNKGAGAPQKGRIPALILLLFVLAVGGFTLVSAVVSGAVLIPAQMQATVPEDWPTYSNEAPQYTLRYPASWILDKGAGGIQLIRSNTSSHFILVAAGDISEQFYIGGRHPANLQEYTLALVSQLTINPDMQLVGGIENVRLGGRDAIRYRANVKEFVLAYSTVVVVTIKDGQIYGLMYTYPVSEKPTEEDTFNKIVGSFRFTQ